MASSKPIKVAVLGSTGMLGSTVFRHLQKVYGVNNVIGTYREVDKRLPGRGTQFDAKYGSFLYPANYVINCIGIIKPHIRTSDDKLTVIEINSVFPRRLANLCKETGAKLIHITTDCVYSGKTGQYKEEDVHDALDVYGKSKSLGEPENCMVLRTSIIGEEPHNKVSLVEWAKSQKGNQVNGFTNHIWNGITTLTYAKVCQKIIDNEWYEDGLFHVFSPSRVYKYDLLQMLSKRYCLGLDVHPLEAPERVDRSLDTSKGLNGKLDIPRIADQIIEM